MSDFDPDAVSAVQSESDLENASEEVQAAHRGGEAQVDESYTELAAVLDDADDEEEGYA